jgi:hypothetical protein
LWKTSADLSGRLRFFYGIRLIQWTAGSTTVPQFQLPDNQWFLISDLFADPPPNPLVGRPFRKNRECFEGVLYVEAVSQPFQNSEQAPESPEAEKVVEVIFVTSL